MSPYETITLESESVVLFTTLCISSLLIVFLSSERTMLFNLLTVFDNVDVDDIAKAALKWEQTVGLIRGGDIAARDKRWASGNSLTLLSSEKVGGLANELCELARENSLDNSKDSPFAMLAKDNDIMWSGGK